MSGIPRYQRFIYDNYSNYYAVRVYTACRVDTRRWFRSAFVQARSVYLGHPQQYMLAGRYLMTHYGIRLARSTGRPYVWSGAYLAARYRRFPRRSFRVSRSLAGRPYGTSFTFNNLPR